MFAFLPAVISVVMVNAAWPTRGAQEEMLPRRPDLGFDLASPADGGAEVRRVRRGSAAERAGLAIGDRVSEISGRPVSNAAEISDALRAIRAGEPVVLKSSRGGSSRTVRFVAPELALEAIPGVEVRYGHVTTSRGHRVRTIVTRPQGREGKLPAIVLVPWLSCDAVETPFGPSDGWSHLLWGLAERSGWVTMRVEKPGVGDSEGPDCSANDLETDLDAYRAGLAAVRQLEFVDADRVVLLGSSLGGALAPLLASEQPVAGLVVSGGFTKTWFEHMLEFERARMAWNGRSPEEINQALRGFAEFYVLYLGGRRTPAEVLRQRPDLAPLWYGEPDGQFGRPAAFYHQVAALDIEAAWSRVSVPVLVLYGEYDWIMSRDDHERAAAIVNARHPGLAEYVLLPRTSHGLETYPSLEDARADRNGAFDEAVLRRILSWLDARFR
jgi:pimeloyl-ACP methyl ester carboxylesterase